MEVKEHTQTIQQNKTVWREQFMATRMATDQATWEAHGQAFLKHAQALSVWDDATCILAYWPIIARREPDVRPLISWLQEQGKQIALPVVVNFGRHVSPLGRMRLAAFDGAEALLPNRWGVLEPHCGPTVLPADLDLVIVPALGVDRRGYRIGHGYGYYDELLASLSVPTICPTYEATLVDSLPREPHDQRMTYIVTETQVWQPNRA